MDKKPISAGIFIVQVAYNIIGKFDKFDKK